jgi:hypothetical protein
VLTRWRDNRLWRVVVGGAAALVITVVLVTVLTPRVRQNLAPPAPVLSNYEGRTGANIVRDCGYSQPLPADPSSSLWLFCDTAVYASGVHGKWQLSRVIDGSTAAEGPAAPGAVPVDLSELTTPGSGVTATPNQAAPAHFLPAPARLKTAAGLDCDSANDAYAASWPSGVTGDPARSSDVLISFNNFCVAIASGSLLPEGFGLAEYDPAANTFNAEVTVFTSAGLGPLAPPELLGSPIFSGSYLYLFASHCALASLGSCSPGGGSAIYLARVRNRASAWTRSASYEWLAGRSTWTANASSAVSILPSAAPLGVSVTSFATLGRGLVLIEQTSIAGRFAVYQATSPTGRWRTIISGTLSCAARGVSFCRAIIGHPDLSTSRDLLVSYFNPSAAPYYNRRAGAEGHVMVASLPW